MQFGEQVQVLVVDDNAPADEWFFLNPDDWNLDSPKE